MKVGLLLEEKPTLQYKTHREQWRAWIVFSSFPFKVYTGFSLKLHLCRFSLTSLLFTMTLAFFSFLPTLQDLISSQ